MKPSVDERRRLRLPGWMLGVLPLLALVGLIWLLSQLDPIRSLTGEQPPVEILSIERAELLPEGIVLHVVNGGPEPVKVAQVQVDEAYWTFSMDPADGLGRLERGQIHIPYPWVEGETHVIRLVTRTGLTFDHTIDVATEKPRPGAKTWFLFALVGAIVGIVPVALGLAWFPLLRRLGASGMQFILALTVGLLVFLLVDTVLEGIEIGSTVPHVFQAVPLVFLAGLLSFLALLAVSRRGGAHDRSSRSGRVWLSTAIAIGIGLHNLGEGMAVGAAITLGEAALGSFLVVGFVLHNVTEGVGIGAPVANDAPGLPRLVTLALVAGAPAIVGVWIGGFSYAPVLAVVFLAVGAGAILQVIYEVSGLLTRPYEGRAALARWVNVGGIATGIAIMYATALLVK